MLAQVGTLTEQMTAGRAFVAIAIVVLGRGNPVSIAIAALLFGVANASQFMFQAMDGRITYRFFCMLPYMLAILALAGAVGRVTAPRDLGRYYVRRKDMRCWRGVCRVGIFLRLWPISTVLSVANRPYRWRAGARSVASASPSTGCVTAIISVPPATRSRCGSVADW